MGPSGGGPRCGVIPPLQAGRQGPPRVPVARLAPSGAACQALRLGRMAGPELHQRAGQKRVGAGMEPLAGAEVVEHVGPAGRRQRMLAGGQGRRLAPLKAVLGGQLEREKHRHRQSSDREGDAHDHVWHIPSVSPRTERRALPDEALTLVTVSHDSEPELVRLIESMSRHLPGAELIVVDSGSSDGGPAEARERGARVVELHENVGYGRAANRGVALAERPVTVVLNPDVELVNDSLGALAGVAEASADRILAPLVLLPDGSRQDTAQHSPTSWTVLLTALVPPGALPPPLRRAAEPWLSNRPRQVAWAVGCCLAAGTETLRRLGPFDERIFLYGEDLELGLRARELGVETWFWPEARIVHYRSSSTDRALGGEPFELLARQRRRVVEERLGRRRRRLDDWVQLVTFAERMALKALLRRPYERERSRLAALRAV